VSGGNQCITLVPEQVTPVNVISMNTAILRVETKNHSGPLQFTVEFLKHPSDLICSVHSLAKVSLDNYIWQFKDKKKMIMRPVKGFDESLLTGK